jgi:septum formation protein
VDLPYPVVLASGSPRRKELLASILGSFEVFVPNVDETPRVHELPLETARRLAEAKAESVAARYQDHLIISADTIVALGERQLGKPENHAHASQMLGELSGKTHRVMTGLCVLSPKDKYVDVGTTEVTFRSLTGEEIGTYVAAGEPMDKAGAYAIQGGAAKFVTNVKGSITNVIGLPMELLLEILSKLTA